MQTMPKPAIGGASSRAFVAMKVGQACDNDSKVPSVCEVSTGALKNGRLRPTIKVSFGSV